MNTVMIRQATFALMLLFTVSGCGTLIDPGAERFASIKIVDHSTEEISTVTARVFTEAGYAGGPSGLTTLVFEKQASGMDTVSRDGLISAHGGTRSIERVKVEVVDLGLGSRRLQCQAFIVSGGGDAFFQEEHRVSTMRSGTYQDLLEKAAKALK